jgi:enterochelin esterase family protein
MSLAGLTGLLGIGLAARGRSEMDMDTYQALGLHEPFSWEQPINSRSAKDFGQFMQPSGDNQYHPCAEAFPAADVPRGNVEHIEAWADSSVFGGTQRDMWIYQPVQLGTSSVPPNLILFQDGAGYVSPDGPVRAPAVLDTLIHAGELPPTVGVFVNPGSNVPSRARSDPEFGRQRSLEYDSMTDAYVRFALEDVLPFVEKRIGRSLTDDPAGRAICGISSGGICAWTAAWYRPDMFGKVLSHCGSFTNIRGGHNYPYLVRTTVRKRIRAILTSGETDLNIPIGSWPLANKQMASALQYAGYKHQFFFGEGGHSLRHGGAIFADSLRWLFE